jgi:hypothetical protein
MTDIVTRERFAKFLRPNKETGCVEWDGARHRQGYGQFYFEGKIVLAHRASWAMYHGSMPTPAQKVCHRCDNPCCVNPEHLFLGTQRDNALDCVAKGRARRARLTGEKNGVARFTDDQVRDIHRDQRMYREIASDYGVAESTIGMIKRGHNWHHIYAEFYK